MLLLLLSDQVGYAQTSSGTNPITLPSNLRPVAFRGTIKWVFPNKGLIILDRRSSVRRRIDVTLDTVFATVGQNGVQTTTLANLRSGDQIFGYLQRKNDENALSQWNALAVLRTDLLPAQTQELRPLRFRSVVDVTDLNEGTLFLRNNGERGQIDITPETLILTLDQQGLDRDSLSALNTGDKVFGYIQRNANDTSFLYGGLIIVKVT